MPNVTLTASDGHELGAYRADPEGNPSGAIVVIQEIFGVNSHIRSICDRLAELGFVAIAPAIFDRTQRNFQSGYSPQEIQKARAFIEAVNWDAFLLDTDAARASVADVGKVGIVGFCLGGSVAFLAATRLEGFSVASGFYGGRIAAFAEEKPQCPTQLHYGSEDQGIPMSNVETVRAKRPDCDIYVYQGADHGFHCDARPSYHEEAAGMAWARMLNIFAKNIG
ncbi:MAG: dienelactone hydrolase family protein [Hyphomicrobiales bacterium]|nr:dienelactone hydrolase family protein [Hyphomicrobiales bacterium]